MTKIYINGLWPGQPQPNNNGGMRISIYLKDDSIGRKTPLFESYSNGEKSVGGEIDDSYIGKEINLIISEPGFQYIRIPLKIKRLGLYYTAHLEKDFNYDNGMIKTNSDFTSFNCAQEYSKAQSEMHKIVRASRYKSTFVLVGYLVITFGSPLLGITYGGMPGVIVGVLFAVLLLWLSPYASGFKSHHNA